MRLIDADGVIAEIKKNKLLAREPATERCMEIIHSATTYVPPVSYDVDKVVEQLENYLFEKYCVEGDEKIDEIVRKGGVE